jgi:rhamnopyranosyl-N-acetylglucosaminyl-diphospho-decaprenol beta-1,3/1,4-galactofuranosyltransferase
MKRAMEAGADWIWVMDDDACATPDALKQLVSSKARQVYGANAVLGSIVVNPENQEQLSFFVPDLKSYYWRVLDYYTNSTDDVSEIMKYNDPCGYPWGTFFNAVLFSRKVISTIGLPRREMFIWGDEVEYFHRTRHAGFKTYIIPFSIFIHPKSNNNVITEAKEKYKIRNRAFVHKTYKRVPAIHHAKDLLSIIASGKFYLLRPFIDGVKGNFTGNYLPR